MKKHVRFKMGRGKYSLVEEIAERLPDGRVLLEPFVGAGSVFLNTDYDAYNAQRYQSGSHRSLQPPQAAAGSLHRRGSSAVRGRTQPQDRLLPSAHPVPTRPRPGSGAGPAVLFLNRHGLAANGLCRYNKKGGFNVPFGSCKKPTSREGAGAFAEAQKASLICESYADAMARAEEDWVICDPPHAPSPPRRFHPPTRRAVSPWTIRLCWLAWPATPPPTRACPCSSATRHRADPGVSIAGPGWTRSWSSRYHQPQRRRSQQRWPSCWHSIRPASNPSRVIILARRSWPSPVES